MKHFLLMIVVVVLVGCGKPKVKVVPNSPKAKAKIEVAIRRAAKKHTGKFIKADLERSWCSISSVEA